jgi:hypothetical protein
MVLISDGLRDGRRPTELVVALTSSAMMSLQSPMHSSQMYTVGPAMSFFTSRWLLPQKEHWRLPWESSCLGTVRSSSRAVEPPRVSSTRLPARTGNDSSRRLPTDGKLRDRNPSAAAASTTYDHHYDPAR